MEKLKKSKNKSQKKTSTVGVVFNTLIYVVLFALLIFAIVINLSKKDNQVTTVFGYAFAVVQSGSMLDGGFEVGDMVIIQDVNTDNIKKGDIIVFYKTNDATDAAMYRNSTDITEAVENNTYQDFKDPSKIPEGRRDVDYSINNGDILIFHRVIGIKVDESGSRFFITKGDSNSTADNPVREDFVVAKYKQTSTVLQGVMSFMSTTVGLVVVILLPIGVLLVSQFIAFGKEMQTNINAIKLLERKVRYTDIDLENYDIEHYFSPPEKVYLYDITPPEDKANLAIILWSEGVNDALEAYKTNRAEYYNYFREKMPKNHAKQLDFLEVKANLIKKNPNISEQEATQQAKNLLKTTKNTTENN